MASIPYYDVLRRHCPHPVLSKEKKRNITFHHLLRGKQQKPKREMGLVLTLTLTEVLLDEEGSVVRVVGGREGRAAAAATPP